MVTACAEGLLPADAAHAGIHEVAEVLPPRRGFKELDAKVFSHPVQGRPCGHAARHTLPTIESKAESGVQNTAAELSAKRMQAASGAVAVAECGCKMIVSTST